MDLTDFTELAIDKPTPANPAAVTAEEKEKILDWLAKNAQAKVLIDQKSPLLSQTNSMKARRHTSNGKSSPSIILKMTYSPSMSLTLEYVQRSSKTPMTHPAT